LKVRLCILSAALVCLSQIPLSAQEIISSTRGQSLQGTWISQLAAPNGDLTLFEVGTFYPDGSYTGANVNPSHSPHVGVWLRTGDRKFAFTVMFFTRDEKGVFNGIVKARGVLTLAEDLQTYSSAMERVVMDTAGRELQVVSGITGTSVRMNVESRRFSPPE
jgi:hypothetical protein